MGPQQVSQPLQSVVRCGWCFERYQAAGEGNLVYDQVILSNLTYLRGPNLNLWNIAFRKYLLAELIFGSCIFYQFRILY